MKIQYSVKENTLKEITYGSNTFQVGELVASWSKGYFKIIKITKQFNGKNFLEWDENDYWNTKPIIQVKKMYSSTGKEVKGKASRTWNIEISSLIKMQNVLSQKEKARDNAINEYNQLKTIIDENKV